MAWQFTGFFSHATIHGPLPVKHWTAKATDPKPRKVKAKAPRESRSDRHKGRAKAERQAIAYAQWLAARDGKTLVSAGSPVWYGDRICAVRFHGINIKLPNWNWEPGEPIEETLTDAQLASLDNREAERVKAIAALPLLAAPPAAPVLYDPIFAALSTALRVLANQA